MIVLDQSTIQIEEVEQILLIEPQRVRCLVKNGAVEITGYDFKVHSLSDHDLVIKGKIKAVALNER